MEGDGVSAEEDAMSAEGDDIHAEGDDISAEGDATSTEGDDDPVRHTLDESVFKGDRVSCPTQVTRNANPPGMTASEVGRRWENGKQKRTVCFRSSGCCSTLLI